MKVDYGACSDGNCSHPTNITPTNITRHAGYISHKIQTLVHAKYLKGQAEHGGDISRKNTLPMAIEEALDLPVYLLILEDNIRLAIEELLNAESELIQHPALARVFRARNILTVGNPEGIPEEEH